MATTILTSKQTRFKDFDLNFSSHPITGDITKLTGDDSIKRAVKNLVLLQFYEKPFHPEIGSDVYGLLFENFDSVLKINLESAIRKTLLRHEPRIEVLDVFVEELPDDNRLATKITFQIINQTEPIIVNVVLDINK